MDRASPLTDMQEHSELVHPTFPKEGASQTRLAGDVVPFTGPMTTNQATGKSDKSNADAAKKGGVGYDPTNVDFGLLDKLGK